MAAFGVYDEFMLAEKRCFVTFIRGKIDASSVLMHTCLCPLHSSLSLLTPSESETYGTQMPEWRSFKAIFQLFIRFCDLFYGLCEGTIIFLRESLVTHPCTPLPPPIARSLSLMMSSSAMMMTAWSCSFDTASARRQNQGLKGGGTLRKVRVGKTIVQHFFDAFTRH